MTFNAEDLHLKGKDQSGTPSPKHITTAAKGLRDPPEEMSEAISIFLLLAQVIVDTHCPRQVWKK